MLGVYDCARFGLMLAQIRMNQYCLLLNSTESAPRSSTHFAAQYPAYGLPCERFTFTLAGNRASLGVETVG